MTFINTMTERNVFERLRSGWLQGTLVTEKFLLLPVYYHFLFRQ